MSDTMMDRLVVALDVEFSRQRMESRNALHLGGDAENIEIDGTVNLRDVVRAILRALKEQFDSIACYDGANVQAMLDEAMK